MTSSGLVIVDKPAGMTSHDVVARMRRIAGTRRVGHAGTLDPMATGVLVIGVEKATRLLGHLVLADKAYSATIRLGQSTLTDDAEGSVTGGSPAVGVTERDVRAAVEPLTGSIAQVPSSVSAIKVGGERAYKRARTGAAVELAARPVTVTRFEVDGFHRPATELLDVDAEIECSSGTYVRSLIADLGDAYCESLRRTAIGPFRVDEAEMLLSLDDALERVEDGA
jgi:tRNA pseudouridine55 synthase